MFTLEHGVITTGFILIALIIVSVVIVGRFFCSWGCHVLALQDLSEWALARIGIRPKPVRMRVLLLLPVAAALYMFAWPQVARFNAGAAWGPMRISTDAQGFGSLMTTDFFRNLPPWWIAVITFVFCGFVLVYLMGSRSFCTYVCPYGAVFAVADRAAIGRIKLVESPDGCAGCAKCTAACNSHIRVHQELARFGRVVSPACLKDLDCVDACPRGAIEFGFSKPSGLLSWRKWGRFGVPYDCSLAEECFALVAGVGAFVVTRGLYGAIPFFLAMAIAALVAWSAVIAVRVASRRDVRWARATLKRSAQITRSGWVLCAVLALLAVFLLQAGAVRHITQHGVASWERGDRSLAHAQLELAQTWSLFHCDEIDVPLASVLLESGAPSQARVVIARIVARDPRRVGWKSALDDCDRVTGGH